MNWTEYKDKFNNPVTHSRQCKDWKISKSWVKNEWRYLIWHQDKEYGDSYFTSFKKAEKAIEV
jgi:hypothetical protein